MIRKLILSAVLAATTLTGLAFSAPAAVAQPPFSHRDERHDHRHVRFEVRYRHWNHWDVYGTYRDRDDAERAAWHLRRQGFEVCIEREGRW